MELSKKIRVLISGASIAGLSTAYWLAKYGFEVTIVERAAHIRPGGQALDVRGPALEVASRMGILETIRRAGTKLKGMSIVDALTGNETYRNTEGTITAGKFSSPDVEILRDDLCHVLFEAVGDQVTYIFNETIVSLDQKETGVEVKFTNAPDQQYDLIIGADGLRSNVRRLIFGGDEQFIRYLGNYVAIFTIPNFLNLDRWEVFFQHEGNPVAAYIVKEREGDARTYLGFESPEPIEYDYRDILSQKKLVAERSLNVGSDIQKIKQFMHDSTNFYFDSINQIIMKTWSKARVVLVGDAGYSVSLSTGQGTTVAMVGAYVLAGEVASHKDNLAKALENYEKELWEYVLSNQKLVEDPSTDLQLAFANTSENEIDTVSEMPDFGQATVPFHFKNY
ncbi:FAD-dependent monooxygenase [Pedobacter sp. MR22-3]|uniref:FAD-dependent monooxygenase n=1 Tax=Pedobacter sp. MR22-3 TaxID=2994552 RepID=UPI002246F3A6|nr:FAD-dependent monooxygenase [Pedobacter sp. MR22-3]MCX2584384.1 FAD-dependent monooxygenase [Pedobacter sp. MR22-3]